MDGHSLSPCLTGCMRFSPMYAADLQVRAIMAWVGKREENMSRGGCLLSARGATDL